MARAGLNLSGPPLANDLIQTVVVIPITAPVCEEVKNGRTEKDQVHLVSSGACGKTVTHTLDRAPQSALADGKLERQQAVLTLLQQFNRVEPLKQLFWSELNYDRVNKPLSRRGWKDGVAGLLADDQKLFASGSDAFHIIYARLASDRLRIGNERPVVSKLMQEHPYALSIFSNSTQNQFHFLNVKYDDDVQKRKLF